MRTITDLLLTFAVLGIVFGSMAATAHASDYEEIGYAVQVLGR